MTLGFALITWSLPADFIAYHRIAELKAMGVVVMRIDGSRPESGGHVIAAADGTPDVVWRWPYDHGLNAEMTGVVRNRIRRENEALAQCLPPATAIPLSLPILREFHRFTLEPGVAHNKFAPSLLGKLLRLPRRRLLVIDPHSLHGRRQVRVLKSFLEAVPFQEGAAARVHTGRVRFESRGDDFGSSAEQEREARRLEGRFSQVGLVIQFPPRGPFKDHDRLVMFHVDDREHGERFYLVSLGQVLFGFEADCRSRSHGVWFQIERDEFERAWGATP